MQGHALGPASRLARLRRLEASDRNTHRSHSCCVHRAAGAVCLQVVPVTLSPPRSCCHVIRTLRAWRPARRTLAQQLAGASQIAACRNIAAKCFSEPASNHLDSTHVSQNDVHGTPHNAADQGDRACESERETRQSQRRQHKRRRKLLAACKLMWRSQVRLWRHFKKVGTDTSLRF
jgi:hypothetical protein